MGWEELMKDRMNTVILMGRRSEMPWEQQEKVGVEVDKGRGGAH